MFLICLFTAILSGNFLLFQQTQNTAAPIVTATAIPLEIETNPVLPKPDSDVVTGTGSTKAIAPTTHFITAKANGKKIIALTFDDGPNPINTPKVLDLLAERKIKASFFVLGSRAQQYPKITKRIVAEGHAIGNHSWDHPVLTKLKRADLEHQILDTEKVLTEIIGFSPHLFRPPYGAFNQTVIDTAKLPVILWSIDSLDWKDGKAADIKKEILKHLGTGKIILLHDIHKTTVEALPNILDTLTKDGYQFVTIDELFNLTENTSKSVGNIYH